MSYVIWGLSYTECDTEGYCSFPRFLWEPVLDPAATSSSPQSSPGSTTTSSSNISSIPPRTWISKTEYFQNSHTWEKQKEIFVYEKEITIHHKIHASCNGYRPATSVSCYRQNVVYHVICVAEEPDGKFRVRQTVNG